MAVDINVSLSIDRTQDATIRRFSHVGSGVINKRGYVGFGLASFELASFGRVVDGVLEIC